MLDFSSLTSTRTVSSRKSPSASAIDHMKEYQFQKKDQSYVAPYTSLLTSSMMGKSRLMKELTQHVPLVYICLRAEKGAEHGYPPATANLLDWFQTGALKHLDADETDSDIASDIRTLAHPQGVLKAGRFVGA